MSLAAGARLGPYEILGAIGAGGMGEVYKARDTRLDRIVALKVLQSAIARDPQFRERFDREARTISALDSPHICALYDVGHEGGVDFLVMQYLEGETLEARLDRGPLPIDQALAVAIQIAGALDKAHRQHIVHRDLKPANVMLSKARQAAPLVHLLDFGLAKSAPAITAANANLPTVAGGVTAEGTILGTLQYMAPEQIEGHDADARTDIFAFGCVLYEMLTARKAFTGKSQASLLGAILKDPAPHLAELQPLAPSNLDRIVTTCLAKDPDERWQSAADLAHELQWTATGLSDRKTSTLAAARSPWPSRIAIGALGLLAGAGVMWVIGTPGHAALTTAVRVVVPVTPADSLQTPRPYRHAFALSPDGQTLAFIGRHGTGNQLYLRPLNRPDAVPVPGTEAALVPFFSANGKWIGYWQKETLRRMPIGGGPSVEICQTPQIMGASWGADDTIVFSAGIGGLQRVPASGGKPEDLTTLDRAAGEITHRLPYVLPDGRGVLFTVVRNLFDFGVSQVALFDLATRTKTIVLENAMDARYVESGHLIFARRGTMLAVPYDLGRRTIAGAEVGILNDVMQAGNLGNIGNDTGAMQVALSATGTLAYVAGGVPADQDRSLVWVDRTGKVEELPLPVADYGAPRLSPDGKRVAVDSRGTKRAVWVYDLERGTLTPIARGGAASYPIWSPDGASVAFAMNAVGSRNLYRSAADGTGTPQRLTTSDFNQWPTSWTSDGPTVIFVEQENAGGGNSGAIQILTPGPAPAPPRVLIRGPGASWGAALSPDGHWLAYAAPESGTNQVYVRSFPDFARHYPVSTGGGVAPAFSRDGKELFYLVGRQLFAVDVTMGATFTAGIPHRIFDLPENSLFISAPSRGYDVSLDGKRFLAARLRPRPPEPPVTAIQITFNWLDELRTKAPVK